MDPVEDQFASLRRLLVVKRHEQPPPGYFDRLPDRIQHRLAAGEAGRPASWWQSLLAQMDLRPAIAGAFALAVGALFLFGLSLPEQASRPQAQAPGIAADPWLQSARLETAWDRSSAPVMGELRSASSISPVLSAGQPGAAMPFGRLQSLDRIQRVNYTVPGQ
jgi:hypothetical protein